MIWTVRSFIAMLLWVAAGLLTLFFIFSGWWIFAPFAFGSDGGSEVVVLLLAIAALAVTAYVVGRRRPT
jgi:VIT1/CCC1 family predicted Fe2+/Mn2+ transporter